ncbi:pyrrolo-quinoline quinone [Paraburkholderia azotifigens]|uniref:Pyrrolo-quinoline quinone n=1 Tax=Paraburkholderia azotifigens TaxID=2057004 RepID=A0ABU9RDJ3_9BURK
MHRQPSAALAPRSLARFSKATVALTLALFCTACGNGSSDNASTSSSDASGNSGSVSGSNTGSNAGSGGSSPSTSTNALATDVLTHHNDLARTGQMLAETTLTPSNVNSSSFGKVAFLSADGKVDGQPLSVTSLSIGGTKHNVVYVVTEHNSVYAYDADNYALLWQVSLNGANETPSDNRGCTDITPEIGITSTPVIDRNRGTNGALYAVAMTKDVSGGIHHRLHALDLASGAELFGGPREISATHPGSGGNSVNGVLTFDPSLHTERVALTLVNGNIFMGWTAHCMAGAYTGWIMSYSADTLQQTGVVNVAPNGHQGSVWMAGSGMASDGTSIYVVDGNGTFGTTLDGNGFPVDSDFGNSFMKLSASPLKVTDYFAPLDVVQLANADGDFGSGGAMLLPDQKTADGTVKHLAVAAGKDNKIYVVDRDAMGKFSPTSNNIWQVLTGTLAGGIWGSPAYFNGTVYYGALNDNIKALPVTNALLATVAASKSPTTFAYPGAVPAISANGTSNAILWAAENGTTGALHAYDATSLGRELYNSNQAGTRDQWGAGNKFITPMISRGKVYVGATNGVAVFGLLH